MSKHRDESSGLGIYLPLGLVGVVAAGGIAWWAIAQGGDDETPDSAAGTTTSQVSDDEAFASAMAAHDHSEETSDPPESTTAGTEDAEVTEEPEETGSTETETEEPVAEGVPDELTACSESVAAAQEVADAAALSAEHWKTHYTAQLKIDSGDYTFEEAGKDWGETKKLGPGDVKRFAAAEKAYSKVADACADLDVDALDEEYADQATSCVERASVLADVVKRGAAVNKDWDDHIEQMKVKADTPADEYYEWWIDVVKDAPKNMKPYDQAVKALKEAPACEVG